MARISKLVYDGEIVGYRTMYKSQMYDTDIETLESLGMVLPETVRPVELFNVDGELKSKSEIEQNRYVIDISGNRDKVLIVFRSYDISGQNQNDIGD